MVKSPAFNAERRTLVAGSGNTSLLVLSGTVDPASGGWATGRVLILLNNYPPGPCKAATTTVTGALIIVS